MSDAEQAVATGAAVQAAAVLEQVDAATISSAGGSAGERRSKRDSIPVTCASDTPNSETSADGA